MLLDHCGKLTCWTRAEFVGQEQSLLDKSGSKAYVAMIHCKRLKQTHAALEQQEQSLTAPGHFTVHPPGDKSTRLLTERHCYSKLQRWSDQRLASTLRVAP